MRPGLILSKRLTVAPYHCLEYTKQKHELGTPSWEKRKHTVQKMCLTTKGQTPFLRPFPLALHGRAKLHGARAETWQGHVVGSRGCLFAFLLFPESSSPSPWEPGAPFARSQSATWSGWWPWPICETNSADG